VVPIFVVFIQFGLYFCCVELGPRFCQILVNLVILLTVFKYIFTNLDRSIKWITPLDSHQLELHLTTIFELPRWILHGHVRCVFITGYLVEHEGLPVENASMIKSAKSSQSQISYYALTKHVPLIVGSSTI